MYEKPLFLELSNQKNRQKKPGNALSDVLLMSRFQKIAADAALKTKPSLKTALRAVLMNELID